MIVNFSSSLSRSVRSSRSSRDSPSAPRRLTGTARVFDAPPLDEPGRPSFGGWTFGSLMPLGRSGISVTVPLAGWVRAAAVAAHDDHVGQVLLGVDVVLAGLLPLLLDQSRVRGDLLGAG